MVYMASRLFNGNLLLEDGREVPWGAPVFPPFTGKPGPTTTGARGVLERYDGNLTIGSNETVEGLDIYGRVDFVGQNSVLKRCRVRNTPKAQQLSGWGMVNAMAAGVADNRVEECTLWSDEVGQNSAGVEGRNITVSRCNIYGVVDGMGAKWAGNNGQNVNYFAYDNWVHGFIWTESTNHADGYTHNDGIQLHTGGNVVIQGNFFECTDFHPDSTDSKPPALTSCVIINGAAGSNWGRIVIEDNWMQGAVSHINAGAGNIASMTLEVRDNICSRKVGFEFVINPKFTAAMVPGLPTASGFDNNNGNVRESGGPVYVHRQAA